MKCKRCGEAFADDGKLRKHLNRVHGGAPNRNKWVVPGGLAAGAVVVVAIVLLAQSDPAVTPASNMARFDLADDPVMGNPEADVILVGFEAAGCSACRHFHLNILPDLKADYFDAGLAQYRFVATTIGYDVDRPGAIAQECAKRVAGDDAFWSFSDVLYRQQGGLGQHNLGGVLAGHLDAAGHDGAAGRACFDGEDTRALVNADFSSAIAADVRGTPTFYLIPPSGEAYQVSAGEVAGRIAELVA